MNENIIKALDFYCQSECNDFMNSSYYIMLKEQAEIINFSIHCSVGKEKDNLKSNDLYISVSVLNENNEFVEIYDEGFLTTAMKLVSEDKGRLRFYSWNNDEEFLEDIKRIINELKNIIII